MLQVHNAWVRDSLRDRYPLAELQALTARLYQQGAFEFPALPNGLFPAATTAGQPFDYTGYSNVWVRDNIHVAHAHFVLGKTAIAVKTAQALMQYFQLHARRFSAIIAGEADPLNPMFRPHIRFNGHDLSEINEKWAHAQNDALGYFLWFYCKLAAAGEIQPQTPDFEVLALIANYFKTVQFWKDEDSGHWEETRKIAASSIGVATAGLKALRQLISSQQPGGFPVAKSFAIEDLDRLIGAGEQALNAILPAECIDGTPEQLRRYDSALLFLIYPVQVVDAEMADHILRDVIDNLQGEYGIRRYLGDSYWCADYKTALAPTERTVDFSEDLNSRDSLLKPGQEAQWCIFDPIISVIYGHRFQQHGSQADLEQQTLYLNRSLGQITGNDTGFPAFRCPESYYSERGRYVPNDITPLLWTQANLSIALKTMADSLAARS